MNYDNLEIHTNNKGELYVNSEDCLDITQTDAYRCIQLKKLIKEFHSFHFFMVEPVYLAMLCKEIVDYYSTITNELAIEHFKEDIEYVLWLAEKK